MHWQQRIMPMNSILGVPAPSPPYKQSSSPPRKGISALRETTIQQHKCMYLSDSQYTTRSWVKSLQKDTIRHIQDNYTKKVNCHCNKLRPIPSYKADKTHCDSGKLWVILILVLVIPIITVLFRGFSIWIYLTPCIGFPHYVELIDPTFRDVGGVD